MAIGEHRIREFSEDEKTIFQLGVLEGKRRLQYHLTLLRCTNNELWEQILELDEIEPLVCVKIKSDDCKKLIAALGHSKKARWAKHWLEKQLEMAEAVDEELMQMLRKRQQEDKGNGKGG